MSGSDAAAIASAPTSQDVRKRWLLLAAALVVGLVAAFAIGSAVKKTSAPARDRVLAGPVERGERTAREHHAVDGRRGRPRAARAATQAEAQGQSDDEQHVAGDQQLVDQLGHGEQ